VERCPVCDDEFDGQTPQQLGQPHADVEKKDKALDSIPTPQLELSDRWILSRYHQVVRQTSNYIDHYGLGEAAKGLYDFIWGDFCDWYIELNLVFRRILLSHRSRWLSKLAYVLEGILKLLHPFMPHITESGILTQSADEQTLALQAYPEADTTLIDLDLEQQFELNWHYPHYS